MITRTTYDADGSVSAKVTARVIGWLPEGESDYQDMSGTDAALFRVKYDSGELKGDIEVCDEACQTVLHSLSTFRAQDLEFHEVMESLPLGTQPTDFVVSGMRMPNVGETTRPAEDSTHQVPDQDDIPIFSSDARASDDERVLRSRPASTFSASERPSARSATHDTLMVSQGQGRPPGWTPQCG